MSSQISIYYIICGDVGVKSLQRVSQIFYHKILTYVSIAALIFVLDILWFYIYFNTI